MFACLFVPFMIDISNIYRKTDATNAMSVHQAQHVRARSQPIRSTALQAASNLNSVPTVAMNRRWVN